MEKTQSPLQVIAQTLIRGYQRLLSPLLGPHCRFEPSCSQYALEAINQHGFVVGSWFSIKRVLKCHPLHPGGQDPVPSRQQTKK